MPLRLGLSLVLFLSIIHPISGQSTLQSIPIIIRENQLYVPVRINGRGPYSFKLESNVPGLVSIDNRLAKSLGLNIVGFQEITEGTQRKRVFLVGIDKVNLGPTARSKLQVRVGDYNLAPQQVLVDGIIGVDFFANHPIQIDGHASQLIILPDTLGSQAQAKGALNYSKPYLVPGKVGPKEVLFNLDVGLAYTMLFPTALLAGVHYADTPNGQLTTHTNPPFVLQEAVITDEIVLGGVRVTHQRIYYSNKVHQITVGVGFLKEHMIRFDQRRKLLKLE